MDTTITLTPWEHSVLRTILGGSSANDNRYVDLYSKINKCFKGKPVYNTKTIDMSEVCEKVTASFIDPVIVALEKHGFRHTTKENLSLNIGNHAILVRTIGEDKKVFVGVYGNYIPVNHPLNSEADVVYLINLFK